MSATDRLMYAEDVLDHALRQRNLRRAALMDHAIRSFLREEAQQERKQRRMESVREQLREAFSCFKPQQR